ncbi:MAG: cytochrome c [Acidobacteria bacterium]|nr:cytochrome c [Acidobacteriota bacterium]MCW5968062.1 cytochrome c [Blastocatellales bacterium]
MRKGARFSVIAILLLFALLTIGISATIGWRPFFGPNARTLTARTFESTPARLERGQYLAESVMGCFYCHSERDWTAAGTPPIESKKGAGAVFHGGPGKLYAPNITPDTETGIGKWSDDAIARAIREGISLDGHALFPIMPYPNYASLPDEDLASLIVYLRSIPAVRNEVPRSEIVFPVSRIMNTFPQPIESEVPPPDLTDPVKRGEHIARQASCADCHTPNDRGTPIPGMTLAGGFLLEEPPGRVTSTNITSDASGIAGYDEETFLKVMRTGNVGGRMLNPTMPWALYGRMTDDDLKALYAYLRSVPPVKHKIDNTAPPTMCRLCKANHGLGKEN